MIGFVLEDLTAMALTPIDGCALRASCFDLLSELLASDTATAVQIFVNVVLLVVSGLTRILLCRLRLFFSND